MKNKTILKKAIEKAVKNGWGAWVVSWKVVPQGNYPYIILRGSERGFKDSEFYLEQLIFSHEFAKAFFKDNSPVKNNDYEWELQSKRNVLKNKYGVEYDWQYYLQQLVLCKEPLKYLEKFI